MITLDGLLYKGEMDTFHENLSYEQLGRAMDSFGDACWKRTPTNETYIYDFNEHIYKKRKVYFHISDTPFTSIAPREGKFRMIPASFFAMDFRTCIEFFKYKFGKDVTAYLHRCVNKRPLYLFNPSSNSDIADLGLNPANEDILYRLIRLAKEKGKNDRYWMAMEDPQLMRFTYRIKKFDGIALDFFKQGVTSQENRTEGFCIFDRGADAIKVIDVAKIDEIPSFPIDPNNLIFKHPSVFETCP